MSIGDSRGRAERADVMSFLVSPLVLRVDVADDPFFADLLGRVREAALGAMAHAEALFERVVEELKPARDPSCQPLFQTMFASRSGSRAAATPRGATLRRPAPSSISP